MAFLSGVAFLLLAVPYLAVWMASILLAEKIWRRFASSGQRGVPGSTLVVLWWLILAMALAPTIFFLTPVGEHGRNVPFACVLGIAGGASVSALLVAGGVWLRWGRRRTP